MMFIWVQSAPKSSDPPRFNKKNFEKMKPFERENTNMKAKPNVS